MRLRVAQRGRRDAGLNSRPMSRWRPVFPPCTNVISHVISNSRASWVRSPPCPALPRGHARASHARAPRHRRSCRGPCGRDSAWSSHGPPLTPRPCLAQVVRSVHAPGGCAVRGKDNHATQRAGRRVVYRPQLQLIGDGGLFAFELPSCEP